MPDLDLNTRFSGWFGRSLSSAPFVDADLLAASPACDYNTATAIQKLRLVVGILLPLAAGAELIHLLHVESTDGMAAVAAGAVLIGIIVFQLEGLLVRSIVTYGATHRSLFGRFLAGLLFAPRMTVALASAVVIGMSAAPIYYSLDLSVADRRDFEQRNAAEIKAANDEFDLTIEPKKTVISNIIAKMNEITAAPLGIDTSRENGEVARLDTLIFELRAALSEREQEQIRLTAQLGCEERGDGCFGASNVPQRGPLYRIVEAKLAENASQIDRLRANIDERVKERGAIVKRRDAMMPSAEYAETIREQRDELRAQLVSAQQGLADAEGGRADFVAKMVPYTPPGVMESFAILGREMLKHPINLVFTAAWMAWLFSLEMAVVTSAVSLRASEYGYAFRRRIARAATDAEIESMDNAARVKIAREQLKQATLDEQLRTTIQARRNEALKGENDDIPDAAE